MSKESEADDINSDDEEMANEVIFVGSEDGASTSGSIESNPQPQSGVEPGTLRGTVSISQLRESVFFVFNYFEKTKEKEFVR